MDIITGRAPTPARAESHLSKGSQTHVVCRVKPPVREGAERRVAGVEGFVYGSARPVQYKRYCRLYSTTLIVLA